MILQPRGRLGVGSLPLEIVTEENREILRLRFRKELGQQGIVTRLGASQMEGSAPAEAPDRRRTRMAA
ncbi:hypothetical protein [Sinomonas humi]|uniref:Uncharacterized protein n=1 Tax=Sinomonas humi TaxID=1338436 RepID=A0A0B2AT33_9MICC|nr:hypothetical protein [Sinomonas humi]KHL05118.1 hypothetical protein LK10_02260 [Sinomonas humi]